MTENLGKEPYVRGPISDIRPSEGCGTSAVHMAGDGGMISGNLDVIWEMPAKVDVLAWIAGCMRGRTGSAIGSGEMTRLRAPMRGNEMRATIQLMTSWAIKGVGVASRVSALALSLAVLLAQMPLLFAAETNTSKTLTIGTEHYPPLSNVNEKGFEDLIAKEMYRRIGINIVLKFLPSERVLFNVNKGLDDGMLSRVGGMNALYPNLVQFEESLFTADYVAFARRTDIQISGWDSLRPYNVGIINGWKILEKNIKGTRSLTKVKNSKQLFSLLDGGRADVIVFSRFSGLQIARDRGLKDIKPLEPPLASRKRFFYLHKKNKVLVPQASAALRDMKADGFYQRIFDNTIGPLITD